MSSDGTAKDLVVLGVSWAWAMSLVVVSWFQVATKSAGTMSSLRSKTSRYSIIAPCDVCDVYFY